jgi:organic hydroperoxide reductase OsmC/OhrA
MKKHFYQAQIKWTGNLGVGTSNYKSYDRSYSIEVESKPIIYGSSDPAFLGDLTKHNPEDLFLASLSSCHMLWYLHFCSEAGITVVAYEDRAEGLMQESNSGKGEFVEVVLKPIVTIKEKGLKQQAVELHQKANEFCFIANSVRFEVKHEVVIRTLA